MKKAKRFLVSLLAFVSVSAFAVGLTGCDDKKPSTGTGTSNGTTIGGGLGGLGGGSSDDDDTEQGGNAGDDDTEQGGNVHTHVFDREVVADGYLKSVATCTAKATYYKSCECGEKGTDTFTYGSALEHVYDQEVVEEEYLKFAATCESVAVYHKSCECGAKGTETFEYGEPLEHVYDQEVVADEYLETAATCTSVAVYHKSCKCGAKGTDTFTYGDFVHTWKDGYHFNASSHWIQCKYCTATKEYGQHVPDDNGGFYCKTCRNLIGVNEGVVYGESEDGTYAGVWGYNEGITTEIVIEAQYNNLPVKVIYMDAFKAKNIVSVVIPDSITQILGSAFSNCSNLTSITFTGTVEEWNAIEKGSNWNHNVPAAKVVCSDGEVAL